MPDQQPSQQPPDRRAGDDVGEIRRRYVIGVTKIPKRDRDRTNRILANPRARWRNIIAADVDDAPDDVDITAPGAATATYYAELTDDEAAELAAGESSRRNNVRYVEEDRLVPPAAITNPTSGVLAWMNASLAQQGSFTGAGVKVAVLDGGTTAAMRAQMSWTMAAKKIIPASVPAGTENMGGHGCVVASCAVPPAGQLVDVLVASLADGSAYTSDMAAGLVYASDQAVKVANLSFGSLGGGIDQVMRDAYEYCRVRGVQVTVAAGNDGQPGISSPAIGTREFSNVHALGAVDASTNQIAGFSNRDWDLSGVLPGVAIQCVDIAGAVVSLSGTSFSAPLAALLIAMACTGGTYTGQQAADALKASARDLGLGQAVQGRGAWSLSHALAVLATPVQEKIMYYVRDTARQPILNNLLTKISFPTLKESNPDVAVNAAKDTFTVNTAGVYVVNAGWRWVGWTSAVGEKYVGLGNDVAWTLPGSKQWRAVHGPATTCPLHGNATLLKRFSVGDKICLYAWQNSGITWEIDYAVADPGNESCGISIVRIAS